MALPSVHLEKNSVPHGGLWACKAGPFDFTSYLSLLLLQPLVVRPFLELLPRPKPFFLQAFVWLAPHSAQVGARSLSHQALPIHHPHPNPAQHISLFFMAQPFLSTHDQKLPC